jgi:nicotinamidase/pyrazinamidase
MKNILLIVDPQNDFISGTLPVGSASEKMMNLANYIKQKGELYDYIYITLDSHPISHCSFIENGGQWPYHCVRYELGWRLPKYLIDVLNKLNNVKYYHKGTLPNKEEYSIFDNKVEGKELKQLIKDQYDDETFIDICGIAGDYCVLETLNGLMEFFPKTKISILNEFTASIDGGKKLETFANNNNINLIIDSSLNLNEYVH